MTIHQGYTDAMANMWDENGVVLATIQTYGHQMMGDRQCVNTTPALPGNIIADRVLAEIMHIT